MIATSHMGWRGFLVAIGLGPRVERKVASTAGPASEIGTKTDILIRDKEDR